LKDLNSHKLKFSPYLEKLYQSDKPLIIYKVKDGFKIKEPFMKAGWTFFNLELSTEITTIIENSGMMKNVAGFRISEQLKNFLGHFLESNGSNVRITKIDY